MRVFRFVFSKLFLCLFTIAVLCAAIVFFCIYLHSLLPVWAALCLSYLLSGAATIFLLCKNSIASEFKCAWLAIIALLPLVGAVLCVIAHVPSQTASRTRPLPETGYSSAKFFNDGAPFLNELTAAVSSARKSVYLEFYIIAKGEVWSGIYARLLSALKRGIDVKIVYDAIGSALRAPKKDFKRLKSLGAEVKAFNAPFPFPLSDVNERNHRKLAVIDGASVFLGGVNLADEYAHVTEPHGFWKDGGAVFYGEAAKTFKQAFSLDFGGEEFAAKPTDAEKTLLPVADTPDDGGNFENAVAAAIYSAKWQVYAFTPYLCVNEKLLDAFAYAAQKGVDTAIIVPAVPDKKLPYAITKIYAQRLAASGVAVYEYTPGFMHFKGVVFDDKAYIGSHNLDFRSTKLNYETGVLCGGEIAKEVKNDFIACEQVSRQLPIKKRTPLQKIADGVLCLLAPLI